MTLLSSSFYKDSVPPDILPHCLFIPDLCDPSSLTASLPLPITYVRPPRFSLRLYSALMVPCISLTYLSFVLRSLTERYNLYHITQCHLPLNKVPSSRPNQYPFPIRFFLKMGQQFFSSPCLKMSVFKSFLKLLSQTHTNNFFKTRPGYVPLLSLTSSPYT